MRDFVGRARRSAVFAVLLIALGGCATKPEIPFDRATTPDVKTIGVLTPRFPDGAVVYLASSPAQSFGLLGALVDSGMQANREATFKTILDDRHFSVQDDFLQSLTDSLKAQNFNVTMVPVQRDRVDFLAAYPPPENSNVDAYLDIVTFTYGYAAAGIKDSTPYRPYYMLKVKLVRAKDGSVLMQDMIVYNPINAGKDMISISADPDYQFVDFDTLTGNSEKAVVGLKVAVGKSASMVGTLLK